MRTLAPAMPAKIASVIHEEWNELGDPEAEKVPTHFCAQLLVLSVIVTVMSACICASMPDVHSGEVRVSVSLFSSPVT